MYLFVNGPFIKTHAIAPDKSMVTTWDIMMDANDEEVQRALVGDAALWGCAMAGSESRAALADLMRIVDGFPANPAVALADLHAAGVDAFFSTYTHCSSRPGDDSYALHLGAGGIGLPTGRYYHTHAAAYTRHIGQVLAITGQAADGAAAFGVEKAVCMHQLTPAQAQDVAATTHWVPAGRLPRGFDWAAYFSRLRVAPAVLNVESVEFVAACVALLGNPGAVAYLRWRCADLLASQMGPAAEAAQFAFYGKALANRKVDRPLNRRRADALQTMLPEYVGQLFIGLRPEEHRVNRDHATAIARMVAAAMRASFVRSTRLDAATKRAWCAKLDRLRYKVGYPDAVPPEAMRVATLARRLAAAGEAWPTVVLATMRARRAMTLGRCGQPIDRDGWDDIQPHTVNACYQVIHVTPACTLSITSELGSAQTRSWRTASNGFAGPSKTRRRADKGYPPSWVDRPRGLLR